MAFFVKAAIVMGVATLGSAVIGSVGAGKQARRAAGNKARLEDKLQTLENERQPIINPYAGVGSLSGMITDLSDMVSNPFANLGVATSAAEIEIEEADIALANTLDILRATGASAGGATALAQAALQSKKGVAASIEQQEAANEKARAQGQANLERMQMAEAQRVQSGLFGEAQRMQEVGVKGKSFVYGEKERRETEQLNRVQAQITGQAQAEVAARQNQTAMLAGGVSALGNIGSSVIGAYGAQQANTHLVNSDRRLKKNIKLIGVSPKGLNIYAFEYINKKYGKGLWQGVMSDEVPEHAVINHSNGFDKVDYSKLDVTFKQV